MLKKIKVDFDFSAFLSADYTLHSGSCVKHQVHELTDIHSTYGGFPKSYCLENTMIHQLWWDETQVDYIELGKQLGIEVVTVSTIMQPPGCTVPLHRDTFYAINQKYPDRKELKVRANIYLEDYKIGQFIQYQDESGYSTSSDWVAGEGFLWDNNVLHLSTNAGMQDKYTLQVSGFYINE
jgi:hypothetical protein